MPFEPKIVAYLCTWCSYTGADTAGIARLKSPANLRAIRVPCSGRVSPEIVLRTFDHGADGVLILGCHPGECHYESGNHRAAKRIPILRALMGFAGLETERLHLDWVSASEGERFSLIVSEFTDTVRALGPVRWQVRNTPVQTTFEDSLVKTVFSTDMPSNYPVTLGLASELDDRNSEYTNAIQSAASELLETGKVDCVIGYEAGTHGRTRPVFIRHSSETDRLIWNQDCTHNLTLYLEDILSHKPQESGRMPVAAVVVKACDERAVKVLLSENRFAREQIHLIGVACNGISRENGKRGSSENQPCSLQQRCLDCENRLPSSYDTLIGDPVRQISEGNELDPSLGITSTIEHLDQLTPPERMEFWLSQFDRCIRCYACRQACPMCYCPTCLFERDDSLWTGMGIGIDEKRTFHLGRAYHLAGRCIGCNECERVCPMNIPISLINHKLAQEMKNIFNFEAGFAIQPSPLVTILGGEEKIPMIEDKHESQLWYITHEELKNWLESIMDHARLIAPQNCEGVVLYKPTSDINQIEWGDVRSAMSMKDAFFPPTEQLMIIEKRGPEVTIRETFFNEKQVIFGARPCDARGVKVFDPVFITTEPVDLYYSERRSNTALIGLACEHMGNSCFCTSLGGSPSDPGDMDIMLTAHDGGYLLQIVSEKGQELVAGVSLQPTTLSVGAINELGHTPVPQVSEWPPLYDDAYWNELSERCLSCRICAYVCPTCRCFDVRDEPLPSDKDWQQFERIRCWDSCTSEGYRRIAGGHNPRDTKAKRLRNRMFCKFYFYPEQYNPVACTGCGRCIDACPVNIDITEVLKHLTEVVYADRA